MAVAGAATVGILAKAWAGIKTVASWIATNPWKTIGITLTWRLIRAIRRKRYESGKMSPFAEKLYELFSPIGDVGDYIAATAESIAVSTMLYEAFAEKAYEAAVAEPIGRMNRNLNRLFRDPVLNRIQ